MATIYHQVWIDAPAERVYEAISSAEGLGKWWAPHTGVQTDDGLILMHDPGPDHGEVHMLVKEMRPNKRVEWEILSSHPESSPASGWMDTRIVFEIARRENPGLQLGIESNSPEMTVVDFRHTGWKEESRYFGFCNFAWGATLLMLQSWCEEGE